MFVFGLRSISDDRLSDPSDEHLPQCQKRPPKSSKNEMFVFGLCSISDHRPSDPSDECQPKCKQGPRCHQKIKCLFLD